MDYYKFNYKTPEKFSNIIMSSDGEFLTGLWFEDSRDTLKHNFKYIYKDLVIFQEVSNWLDTYFKGEEPNFMPKYKINYLTPFRKEVIEIINNIPFGKTITYNDIAKKIAKSRKIEKISAQAVGGAVGWNPICIIIPCHRVVGTNGSLTGYGGGIKNKVALLENEKIDMKKFFIPKYGTAL